MSIETKNLLLIPHHPAHLLALIESDSAYEKISGMHVARGVRESLLAGSPEFFARLKKASAPDPWQFGFAVVDKIDNVVMGMGGFPGAPDTDGAAEIAYGIAPAYRAKGYATETALALMDFAGKDPRVKLLRAHTLAETNASTRILEKCGFRKVSETVDPENNLPVWRWEKHAYHPERSEGPHTSS